MGCSGQSSLEEKKEDNIISSQSNLKDKKENDKAILQNQNIVDVNKEKQEKVLKKVEEDVKEEKIEEKEEKKLKKSKKIIKKKKIKKKISKKEIKKEKEEEKEEEKEKGNDILENNNNSQEKNDNLPKKLCLEDKKENNAYPNQLNSNDNNTFPIGTKFEKALNSNFKYFNVFWYDPNKTNDFNCFKKCFENVEFCRKYNLESSINFFKKEKISEWIVVTPGSKGKELIQNLEKFRCIYSFFIYCIDSKSHESCAKNIKKLDV